MGGGPSDPAGPTPKKDQPSPEIEHLNSDPIHEKMEKRLAGASSWQGFFNEAAMKLAFLAVLVLVIWVVSATR